MKIYTEREKKGIFPNKLNKNNMCFLLGRCMYGALNPHDPVELLLAVVFYWIF